MNMIIGIIVFLIVLFIYLHIYFQLKTSNDLEIYNIESLSKEKLEEICDLKQPILFKQNLLNDNFSNVLKINELNKSYGNFDIKLVNLNKYLNSKSNIVIDEDSPIYVPIKLSTALDLFNKDKDSKYYTENNYDFIEESCLIKHFRQNDGFLRPYMVSNCEYDIILSSSNVQTPLKYNITYRNFFIVTEGKIKIRLIPPKSSKYLYAINDYNNFTFYSPVNVWQPQDEYKKDFNKVKYLDVSISPGNCFYIPPYWWYSMSFDSSSLLTTLKYKTYMNTFSNLPKYIMKFLQLQNVKHKRFNGVDNNENDINENENINNENENINNENINNENENINNENTNKNDVISHTSSLTLGSPI
jgi:hypothetical protein